MPDGWRGDLSPVMRRICYLAMGGGGWVMLRAGSRVALALPRNRRAARVVIGMYQPHRLAGRLFRLMARMIVTCGGLGWLCRWKPTVVEEPVVEWLAGAAKAGTVGFLGANPAHGPRCVLAGFDPADGRKFVAKLGFDGSASSIRREHAVLESLHGRYHGVIESHRCEGGRNWALLRLPHLGEEGPECMADPGIEELLRSWMSAERVPLESVAWARELIGRVGAGESPEGWHAKMLAKPVNRALVHGDFAVWNTRRTPDGLCALDWEWAVEDGLAGVDLAHGLRQECYMVRRMSPAHAVAWMRARAGARPWKSYLDDCGWGDAPDDWLRFGLLHSHFNALNASTELLDALGIHLTS